VSARLSWVGAVAALVVTAAPACDVGNGGNIDGPATWTALYTDYFAPSGAATCGGSQVGCHSSAGDTGAIVSNFVCADKASCYESLTSSSHLLAASDAADPGSSKFVKDLRQPGGSGRMPKSSAFVFESVDLARIEKWIANGAPDD
jgi:hypothetical protein